MHRVRVFLNHSASSTGKQDWKRQISLGLFRSEVEYIEASSQDEFLLELKRAAEEKIDVVISVGGDGTFHTLIQVLSGTETSFLVVPGGTANDLARELGVEPKLKKAIESIRRNQVHAIDLISVNGKLMATNGGFGLVSDVANRINTIRKQIPGFNGLMSSLHHHVYGIGLAAILLGRRYTHYNLRIESDAFTGKVRTPLLLVNNQPTIAGSFKIAPLTVNNDGKFNVSIFAHDTWTAFVEAIYRVRKGLPVGHDPNFIQFETSSMDVSSLDDKPLRFHGDGEYIAEGAKVEFRLIPSALKVFRPFHKYVTPEKKPNVRELLSNQVPPIDRDQNNIGVNS